MPWYKTALSIALAAFLLPNAAVGQLSFTLTPSEDAFVREQAPDLNYGAAGALCVAGASSQNAQGQPRGRFDTVLKFDAAGAVAAFDSAYGAGGWTLSSAELRVNEVGAPNNDLFPVGVGDFTIDWLSDDSWAEGTGAPGAPVVGSGNIITWQLLQSMLATATEADLGAFSNAGANGLRIFPLMLDPLFVDDLSAAGAVSLHAAPISEAIGFTFNSRSVMNAALRPQLVLTAVPEPAALTPLCSCIMMILWRPHHKATPRRRAG